MRKATPTCKLQINCAGAWRNVLSFDIEAVDVEAIKTAAAHLVMLADPAGKRTLRIASDDGFQIALVRWNAKIGWVDA